MEVKSILVIEDEQNVATFIKKGLEEEGYHVSLAYDGELGLHLFHQQQFDLVILDIILPKENGIEVCQKIRKAGIRTPIIMLTALGTTNHIVSGLDAGADDYLVKPFKFRELLARIRAILRRKSQVHTESQKLSIGDLTLDLERKSAFKNDVEIKLTSTEFRLLRYFLKNQRKVLSRIDILENVWDINFDMGTNVVDVYVNYLRNKIEKPFNSKLIHTVIGMGYILKVDA